jgi:hypothetical protein
MFSPLQYALTPCRFKLSPTPLNSPRSPLQLPPCSRVDSASRLVKFLAGGAPICYGKTPIPAERGDSTVPPWYPWTLLDLALMHIFSSPLILQYLTTTEARRRHEYLQPPLCIAPGSDRAQGPRIRRRLVAAPLVDHLLIAGEHQRAITGNHLGAAPPPTPFPATSLKP